MTVAAQPASAPDCTWPPVGGHVTVPSHVTTVTDLDFAGCPPFVSISLPHGLRVIGEKAFYKSALASVVLPDTVVTIESQAFNDCLELGSVRLPDGLRSIGDQAFYNCVRLS